MRAARAGEDGVRTLVFYEIGPPLAEKGFSEDRIVFALYDLKDEGTIDLTNGNRLVLLKP
jgi:hypothetical protein